MTHKAAGQSAQWLTDLLTRLVGTREMTRDSDDFTWSARRAGAPETEEMRVVVLITQRRLVERTTVPRPHADGGAPDSGPLESVTPGTNPALIPRWPATADGMAVERVVEREAVKFQCNQRFMCDPPCHLCRSCHRCEEACLS
jgi:hypothetical protein